MLYLRLFFAFFYYLPQRKRKKHFPILVFFFATALLGVSIFTYLKQTAFLQKQLLSYSPTLTLSKQREMAMSFYHHNSYEVSFLLSAFMRATAPLPSDFWPDEMKRFLSPVDSLRETQRDVWQQLEIFPTSRDLWLYNGWIALYLGDMEEVRKTTTNLMLIDPNNENVQLFFKQL